MRSDIDTAARAFLDACFNCLDSFTGELNTPEMRDFQDVAGNAALAALGWTRQDFDVECERAMREEYERLMALGIQVSDPTA